jgi:hypothetical protein
MIYALIPSTMSFGGCDGLAVIQQQYPQLLQPHPKCSNHWKFTDIGIKVAEYLLTRE